MTKAKLFMNGRSQAVRLPKEFRFEGSEVSIRRAGNAVILEPVAKRQWPTGFFESIQFEEGEGFELPEDELAPDIDPVGQD
ncbi:MAG: AbrB/MazE/SpoVT family DNA-binding domain-containing protein [Verrucomicrobiae bacterium]|nr:AbrB/MazE/SpoVT family DNA-binding domain-containing protein [Verrucomicrobiae bacterium]